MRGDVLHRCLAILLVILVMNASDGCDLSTMLRRRHERAFPLTEQDSVALLRRVT